MKIKNPVIPIFAGLLGVLIFWFTAESQQDALINNMLPELIGFCLEGIFFVGIFTWLQERKDRERKTDLKESLAGAVGFICPLINGCFSKEDQIELPPNENWTRQARKNGRHLANLLARLSNAELQVAENQIQAMQQLLLTRISTLDSLLSVSAQLSHSHLSAFNMILTEIHKLSKHHYFDNQELKTSFTKLLRLLISFNNEPI